MAFMGVWKSALPVNSGQISDIRKDVQKSIALAQIIV